MTLNDLRQRLSVVFYTAVDCLPTLIGAAALGLLLGAAMAVTGCAEYVMQQADKDVAVSTVYPRINNQTDIDEFKRQNKHANEFLAKVRSKGYE